MIQCNAFWSFWSSLNGVRKDCVTFLGEEQSFQESDRSSPHLIQDFCL